MPSERNCTVCDTALTFNYCPNCGQELRREVITVNSLVLDFFQNLLSLDKSVFATIYRLVINPEPIIHNYWSGYRRYYPSPGKLVVYAITIAALQLAFVHPQLLGLSFNLEGVGGQFVFWMFFFPLLTLTSYLAFIRRRLPLVRHIIGMAYLASSFFIIVTVLNAVVLKL